MKSHPNETEANITRLPDRTQIEITEIRIRTQQACAVILGMGGEANDVLKHLAERESKFSIGIQRLPGCRITSEVFKTGIEEILGHGNNWSQTENLAVIVWNSHDWISTRAAQSLVNQYADFGIAVITMDLRGRILPGAGNLCTTLLLPQVTGPDAASYLSVFLCGLLPPAISDTWLCLDFSQGRTPLLAGEFSWCATGQGILPDGATKAISDALASAELRGFSLEQAKAVLLSYTVSPAISVNETWQGAEQLKSAMPRDCHMIYSLNTDESLEMKIEATLIVSGKRQG